MSGQLTIFDYLFPTYKITKPIRLIEFFSGIGAQAKSLKNLNANFEHWKTCEWAIPSILAYNEIHHKELKDYGKDFAKDLTKEELIDYLFKKGISSNYNEPMKLEQIKRLPEDKLRKIYNAIKSTNDLVNIQQVHGADLEIVNKMTYEYILTYSFPCQDLSLAGLKAGMDRDGGTRSGMLWEVERILKECEKLCQLPQILLMENVPQVQGSGNVDNFVEWQRELEKLGYSNYFQILNAKDYGIPQNRERCFMVSILGQYNYSFPDKIPLELKLKDMLEDQVDEKFYLSDKQIKDISNWNAYEKPLEHIDQDIVGTLTTRSGEYTSSMKLVSIPIKNATQKGYLEAASGDAIDISGRMEYHRGTVQKGISQTLSTSGGNDVGVVVEDTLKRELCNKLIQDNLVEDGDVVKHSYTQQILNGNKKCVEKSDGVMITLTTRPDCVGVVVKDNYMGTYQFAKSDNFMNGKDRYQPNKQLSDTLQTSPKEAVVIQESLFTDTEKQLFTEDGNIKRYLNSDVVDEFKEGQMATTTYPNGYGHGPRTHDLSISLNTIDKPAVKNNLRIRKLTPKECYRLMGFADEDYENAKKVLSDSMVYHTAGDSIVVNVLMKIFERMM